MQRKTFWEEIRPKEIYSAKTSCSSKIPIPTLIIAQNNIHGFRLPEAWSPVSKLFSERNLYYFCPHWHTSSFHIEQQDEKIFVVQKNQFPGRNFTAKYFQQKPFVGVLIRCLRFSRLIFPCLKFKDFSSLNFIYGMPDLSTLRKGKHRPYCLRRQAITLHERYTWIITVDHLFPPRRRLSDILSQ